MVGGHVEHLQILGDVLDFIAVLTIRGNAIMIMTRLNSSTRRIGVVFDNDYITQKIIGRTVVLDENGHNEDGQHESDDGILGGSPQ